MEVLNNSPCSLGIFDFGWNIIFGRQGLSQWCTDDKVLIDENEVKLQEMVDIMVTKSQTKVLVWIDE